jgi:hypothetical protein
MKPAPREQIGRRGWREDDRADMKQPRSSNDAMAMGEKCFSDEAAGGGDEERHNVSNKEAVMTDVGIQSSALDVACCDSPSIRFFLIFLHCTNLSKTNPCCDVRRPMVRARTGVSYLQDR